MERSTTTDIGIDVGALKNRLSLEVDYYYKKTTGILYRPAIPITMGGLTAPRMNIAEVSSHGFDMSVSWRDRIGKVDYSISANFGYTTNKVDKYKGKYKEGWGEDGNWYNNKGDVFNDSGSLSPVVEGHKLWEYYMKEPYKGSGKYYNNDGTVNIHGGPKDGMIRTEADMDWVKAMIAAGYEFQPNKTIGKIIFGMVIIFMQTLMVTVNMVILMTIDFKMFLKIRNIRLVCKCLLHGTDLIFL